MTQKVEGGSKEPNVDHSFLYRVCSDVIEGRVTPDSALKHLQQSKNESPRVSSLLLDVLQTVDLEVDQRENKEEKERFHEFYTKLFGTVVPQDLLKVSLDSLLDKEVNGRVVKLKTKLFYKQTKYNLLREESEGYAKLIGELSQEITPDFTSNTALERVKCLIGQFNLDPNRVLDVMLECFECRLEEHEFFVSLFSLYGVSKENICALIGFKFTCYQSRFKSKGDTKWKADVPDSLYRLAAMLIHSNLLDMLSLCAYLTPNTDWIIGHSKRQVEEGRTRAKKAQTSSLAVAESIEESGSLLYNSQGPPSSGNPAVSGMSSTEGNKFVTEAVDFDQGCNIAENQRLGLLWGLLDIGHWPSARIMLQRLPEFYAVRCARISLALIDIVDRMIHDFYKKKCSGYCLFVDSDFAVSDNASKEGETPGTSRSSSTATSSSRHVGGKTSRRRAHITGKRTASPIERQEENEEKVYVGDEQRKRGDSWAELAGRVFPLLSFLGPYLGYRPLVFTKLIRLLSVYVQERDGLLKEKETLEEKLKEKVKNEESMETDVFPDSEQLDFLNKIFPQVVDICDEVLLPALSMQDQNCATSEELWNIIGSFSYQVRYRLYGRWKNEHIKSHPILAVKKGQIYGRSRYVMKRLSKETIKLIGRQLGKMSHTQPSVVFDYILEQVQTFENLIGPVVESLRYLSNLEFDVLTYCIIEHLASPEKQKLKVSDATLSPWLQSLAMFVGTVFKKYDMELSGVLQYVANQLKAGKSFDLLVLREIVQNMSGVETTSGLTQEQLEAWTGGDLLRQEGGYFGQVRNIRKTSNRLKEALFQEDLVVSLCILMAQQRGSIVFKEGEGIHLKLVGQMLDQCHDTLVQFGSFLQTSLKPEDYNRRMPSAPQLMSEYNISSDAAMFLSRPIYSFKIQSRYEELKKKDRAEKVSVNSDRKAAHYATAVREVMSVVMEEMRGVLEEGVWKDITPQLYSTFWNLSTYDLHLPSASYDRELDKIKNALKDLDDSRDSSSKTRKEKERLTQLEQKLTDEKRHQQEHVNRVTAYIKSENSKWFHPANLPLNKNKVVSQFYRQCIGSRCVFSDLDALFCAKFIRILHFSKTPEFHTLIFFEKLFGEMGPYMLSLTENEAHYYGRFLCACLDLFMKWHGDIAVYEKECVGYPGFAAKLRKTQGASADGADIISQVGFEDFRHVVQKWHWKLCKTMVAAITSGTYVGVRNALIVLLKIIPHFPVIDKYYVVIDTAVTKVREREKDKRQDLTVLAASYWGHLKLRKVSVIPEDQFHILKTPDPVMKKRGSGSASSTPNSSISKKTLTQPKTSGKTLTTQPRVSGSQVNTNATSQPNKVATKMATATGTTGTAQAKTMVTTAHAGKGEGKTATISSKDNKTKISTTKVPADSKLGSTKSSALPAVGSRTVTAAGITGNSKTAAATNSTTVSTSASVAASRSGGTGSTTVKPGGVAAAASAAAASVNSAPVQKRKVHLHKPGARTSTDSVPSTTTTSSSATASAASSAGNASKSAPTTQVKSATQASTATASAKSAAAVSGTPASAAAPPSTQKQKLQPMGPAAPPAKRTKEEKQQRNPVVAPPASPLATGNEHRKEKNAAASPVSAATGKRTSTSTAEESPVAGNRKRPATSGSENGDVKTGKQTPVNKKASAAISSSNATPKYDHEDGKSESKKPRLEDRNTPVPVAKKDGGGVETKRTHKSHTRSSSKDSRLSDKERDRSESKDRVVIVPDRHEAKVGERRTTERKKKDKGQDEVEGGGREKKKKHKDKSRGGTPPHESPKERRERSRSKRRNE